MNGLAAASIKPKFSFFLRASGFNQFGLYHDDCLYENDDVKEALSRLPAVSVNSSLLFTAFNDCFLLAASS